MTVNVCDTANVSVNEVVSRSFLGGDDEVDSEARAVLKQKFNNHRSN